MPPIDDGSPEILSAIATILPNGNAQLIVEAENSAGGNEDLTYQWDLDGDGVFETAGGNAIEIPPGDGPDLYQIQVRITDGADRWTEGRYQFTAGGEKVVQLTVAQGKKLFRDQTPIPSNWPVHHTLQVGGEDLRTLERRFWKELGIDINKPQYLRGVPKFVHDQITGDQNAWIEKYRKEKNLPTRAAAFADVPLTDVIVFTVKMEAKYSRYWVLSGAVGSQINAVANIAKAEAVLLTRNKAARRVDLGILATSFAVFGIITSNSKVYANMENFNPNTHAEFNNFKDKYEDCLIQAMSPAGRPSKEAAYQLVDTLIEFGRVMGLDPGALDKAKTLMNAGIQREYF